MFEFFSVKWDLKFVTYPWKRVLEAIVADPYKVGGGGGAGGEGGGLKDVKLSVT